VITGTLIFTGRFSQLLFYLEDGRINKLPFSWSASEHLYQLNIVSIIKRLVQSVILFGTVYFGGSGKSLHFAIYFRNPVWKPEFTGTILAIIPATAETLGSINACHLRVCRKNACILLLHDS
jgi:hypothetical protein